MHGVAWVAAVLLGCGDSGTLPADAVESDAPCTRSLSAIPAQVEYGSVSISQPGIATIAITSAGSCRTRAISHAIGGANAGDFAVASSSCAGTELPPGAVCSIDLRFAPASTGAKQATLDLDGGDQPLRVVVQGAATTAAQRWTIQPGVVFFLSTAVSQTSAAQRFTVTSLHAQPSSASIQVSLAGPDPSEFRVVGDTCSPAALAPGETCFVDVVFSPSSTGAKLASLGLSDLILGTASATLNATAVGEALLLISPAMIDFGPNAVLGSVSLVTVMNAGGVATGPLAVSLSGANASTYEITNDQCTAISLSSAQSCTFQVRATCTGAGSVANAVASVTASPGGTRSIPITGTVGGAACNGVLLPTPTTYQFADQPVMTSSAPAMFLCTNNTGQPTIPLPPTELRGTNPADFTITSDSCGGVIVPVNGTCSVGVAFSPRSGGFKNASLYAAGSNAALSGTGLAGLHVDADTCAGTTLSGGGSCRIDLGFHPTATGARMATITVTATPGATVVAALAGTGQVSSAARGLSATGAAAASAPP